MDVLAAAAAPWLALGAVLGVLFLLAVGAVVVALRSRPGAAPAAMPSTASPTGDEPRDDLAGFRDHPPGTSGARDDARDGWAPLAPVLPAPAAPPAPAGAGPGRALAALAVAALALVGVAAALAAAARPADPEIAAAPSHEPAQDLVEDAGVSARLAFGGVVLEEHAVGITAGYPELELASQDGRTVATLRLPAANCLAVAAPPDAGDPACRAARTEYAELSTPELRVVRDGDELTVSGRFATTHRVPGAAPSPTGRSHEVSVTVTPAGESSGGWVPAEGRLDWDGRRTTTRTDGPPNVLRADG